MCCCHSATLISSFVFPLNIPVVHCLYFLVVLCCNFIYNRNDLMAELELGSKKTSDSSLVLHPVISKFIY